MIKSLTLTNWKSFESALLWVDALTFIIGTNSAGKSNIVDALSFLADVSSGRRLSDINVRGGIDGIIKRNQSQTTLTIELLLGKDEYAYEIAVAIEGKDLMLKAEKLTVKNANGQERILFAFDGVGEDYVYATARFPKDKNGDKELPVKREVAILSQVPYLTVIKDVKEKAELVANAIKSIFILDPKPEKMRAYTPLADKLASDGSNIAGVIAAMPEDAKKSFEESLTSYVRPLPEKDLKKIWAQTVGLLNKDAMLYCTEEWVDGQQSVFDATSMSDGTLRFIAIISALLTAPKGSTIVIEEVDNGLHPSRAGELVMALKDLGSKNEVDIICTTHNPVLIDALGPEMLPFISFVSRSEVSGSSEISPLEDMPHLLKLLANYSPGDMMIKGILSSGVI